MALQIGEGRNIIPVHVMVYFGNYVADNLVVSPPTSARKFGRPWTGKERKGRPRTQLVPPSNPATTNVPSQGFNRGMVSPPLEWQDDPAVAPVAPPFIGRRQHHLPAMEMSPLDVIQLFLDDEFYSEVVTHTNEYASQCVNRPTRRSGMAEWRPIDVLEIRKFFGLLFTMGIFSKPAIRSYWSTHRLLRTNFHQIMSRKRFEDILRYLCVVDVRSARDSSAIQDRLWRIRPFIDRLLSTFKTLFEPGKELSLDEATCPFKGRDSFRKYNPKWGIKVYELCDAATRYCCSFKIAAAESSTAYDVVFDLMHDYLGKGHELYVDHYYTSIPLFRDLYAKQTLAVGTCQVRSRSMPKTFLKQKIPRGSVVACRQGSILALRWRERDVAVLSTKHTPEMAAVSMRAPGGRVSKEKPVAVQEYCRHMLGVDSSDQDIMWYYHFKLKRWKKVFFHLISLALVNAHKLYEMKNEHNDHSMPLSEFVVAAFDQLVGRSPRAPREDVPPSPIPVSDQHFPEYNEATSNESHARLECKVCSKKRMLAASGEPPRKLSRTTTECRCQVCKVPLCIFGCFEAYHTKENYWE